MSRNNPNYLNETPHQQKGRDREKKARNSINSGAVWFDPRDLQVKETDENYLVDVKDVSKQKGFRFSLADIDTFYKQAGTKTPIYLVYIGKYLIKASIQIQP